MKIGLNLTLAQKAFVLVCVPLVFEIAFVATLARLLTQAEHERYMEAHAKDVQSQLNSILGTIIDSAAGLVITEFAKSKRIKERYGLTADHARAEYRHLVELVRGHPDEEKDIEHIGSLITQISRVLKKARQDSDNDDKFELVRDFGTLQALKTDFSTAMSKMTSQQKEIERARSRARMRARVALSNALYLGLLFNIVLAVGLALYFNRGTASRMIILMDNTKRLARGEPLNPPIGGNDEIAHLDKTFSEMADALALASRKERAIIANARDVICSLDTELQFSAVNPAAVQVWGYAAEELIGKSLAVVVPEDELPSFKNNMVKIAQGESELPAESRIMRKDGSEIEMLWSVQWSKQEETYFCVAHDITERKQIERMKREFVAMVSHDLRTPLTAIQGFLNLLDAGAYGELTDAGANSLAVADTSITRLIKLINDLLDAERLESGKFELQLANVNVYDIFEQSADAVEAFAQQQKVRILFGPEAYAGLKATAAESSPATEPVIPLSEQDSASAAQISPVSEQASPVSEPVSPASEPVGPASEPVGSASEPVGPASEPVGSASEPVGSASEPVGPLAQPAGSGSGKAASASSARLSQPSADASLIILADGDRLIQVLVNLISNAIKFSPEGSTIRLVSASADDFIELRVIDEGRGIPAEYVDSVFERFKQVKKSDAKNKKGTGLGLAICKAIVEKHGGSIGVTSQEGKGSTFWFRIPKKLSL